MQICSGACCAVSIRRFLFSVRLLRMKKVLLYVPVVLSLGVLGAHFMRNGDTIFVVRLMQVVLVLGALEWVHTLYELAQVRAALGEPYGRMLVILGLVAAITACSALVFQSKALKGVYGLEQTAPDH